MSEQKANKAGMDKLAERGNVKNSSDYHRHAEECRALAARMLTCEQREQLMNVAVVWERLAENRSDLVRKHPEREQALDDACQE